MLSGRKNHGGLSNYKSHIGLLLRFDAAASETINYSMPSAANCAVAKYSPTQINTVSALELIA
jgi:hypothetical protein